MVSEVDDIAGGNQMLVLSRKKGECVIIHDNIVVKVIEVRCDRVCLGIEASKDVLVHRSEVYEAIKRSEGSLMKSSAISVINE